MSITIYKSVHCFHEGTLIDRDRHDFDTLKEAFDFVEELKKEFTDPANFCLFNIHNPKEDARGGLAYKNTHTIYKTTRTGKYTQVACELTLVIE